MPKSWTRDAMERRLVRYRDLRACTNAFVDTYTPGSDRKENFTIIGPGVAENPNQYVHIAEPHGFNIGGARQPPGCTNSQHSHQTEEVFIVHSGQWAFRLGERGQDCEAILGPGDCISLPTDVFRGFENVGDGTGYLFAVLGGDDPGKVLWAPDVFVLAKEYGLVLLENGSLIDTTRGESIPEGLKPMPMTTREQVDAHRTMTEEQILDCVLMEKDQGNGRESDLTRGVEGARETAVLGPASPAEGIGAGKMSWNHGFQLRRLDMLPGAVLPQHARAEEEVIYVFRGELSFHWDDKVIDMSAGDVLTVPKRLMRSYSNAGTGPLIAYVVRGGNAPAAARMDDVGTALAAAD